MVSTSATKPVRATKAMIEAFDAPSISTADVPQGALVWRFYKGAATFGRARVTRRTTGRGVVLASISIDVIARSDTWRGKRYLGPGTIEVSEALEARIDTDLQHGRRVFFELDEHPQRGRTFKAAPLPDPVAKRCTFRQVARIGDAIAKLILRSWHVEHDPAEPVYLLSSHGTAEVLTRPGSTLSLAGKVFVTGEAPVIDTRTAPQVDVGTIYTYSWGYNQTNVNAFQVVAVSKSGWTATVRPIGTQSVDSSHVVPVPGAWLERDGDPSKVRLREDGSFKRSCGRAYRWNGEPKYETPYGQGH